MYWTSEIGIEEFYSIKWNEFTEWSMKDIAIIIIYRNCLGKKWFMSETRTLGTMCVAFACAFAIGCAIARAVRYVLNARTVSQGPSFSLLTHWRTCNKNRVSRIRLLFMIVWVITFEIINTTYINFGTGINSLILVFWQN